ncbi:RIPK2 [Symbiodinium natans]|uniref:Poly [ADP-ribose] polymerase n=1 Tax=Symbiodinium natans TaxID=878477 RepID=A0A812SRL8_9DINO|nr:RIPK2 [Symbiodinium natans]
MDQRPRHTESSSLGSDAQQVMSPSAQAGQATVGQPPTSGRRSSLLEGEANGPSYGATEAPVTSGALPVVQWPQASDEGRDGASSLATGMVEPAAGSAFLLGEDQVVANGGLEAPLPVSVQEPPSMQEADGGWRQGVEQGMVAQVQAGGGSPTVVRWLFSPPPVQELSDVAPQRWKFDELNGKFGDSGGGDKTEGRANGSTRSGSSTSARWCSSRVSKLSYLSTLVFLKGVSKLIYLSTLVFLKGVSRLIYLSTLVFLKGVSRLIYLSTLVFLKGVIRLLYLSTGVFLKGVFRILYHNPVHVFTHAAGMDASGGQARASSSTGPSQGDILGALAIGIKQLQDVQLKQMERKPEGKDTSAIDIQDWLEAAEEYYQKWVTASPMEKLALKPTRSAVLEEGRCARVNARAASMVLAALNEEVRTEMVTRKATSSTMLMVYRLLTMYRPGGEAEKTLLLKQLTSPTPASSATEVVEELRRWGRWFSRARDIDVATPDPVLLTKGLGMIVDALLQKHPQVSFRTSLMRSTLQLDAGPTLEQTLSFHEHLQAEMELLATSSSSGSSEKPNPKARSVATTSEANVQNPKGGSKGKQTAVKGACKWFAKKDCPTKTGEAKPNEQREKPSPKSPSKGKGKGHTEEPSAKSMSPEPEPQPTSPSTKSESQETGQDLKEMLGEATKAIKTLMAAKTSSTSTSSSGTSQGAVESLQRQLDELRLKAVRVCAAEPWANGPEEQDALIDSGATNILRPPRDEKERQDAVPVSVVLAGDTKKELVQNDVGTIIAGSDTRTQTIIPMCELVNHGWKVTWTGKKLAIKHPEFGRMRTALRGGCPEVAREEVRRIIDHMCRELYVEVKALKARIDAVNDKEAEPWTTSLRRLVELKDWAALAKAIETAPMFKDLPGKIKDKLFTELEFTEEAGWNYMKDLPLTRRERRKLLRSKRWVVNLFSGKGAPDDPLATIGAGADDDRVLLNVDIERSKAYDLTKDGIFKILMGGGHWKNGRSSWRATVSNVLCDEVEGSSGERVDGDTELIAKMFLLYMVSKFARPGRATGFLVEHPRDPKTLWNDGRDYASLWRTQLWLEFMKATGLDVYSFDQGALEHPARKPTTIGTNYALEHLNGLVDIRVKSENAMKMDPAKLATWSRGLRREIAKAIDDRAVVSPKIKAMTAKQRLEWRRHLQADHVPFRTEYPQASLALDMAGPFKTLGRDLYEKDYKYLLVGRWLRNMLQRKSGRGPSGDVTDGHIMARDDGGLVVAKGVRVNLIDPTELEPRLLPELRGSEVKYKPPTRRAKGKTPGVLEEELEPEEGRERNLSPPERYAKECLEKENITQETLEMLMALLPHDELSRDAFSPPDPEMWAPKQWGTGAYVHGGVMGLKKNVKMFKYSTKMMAYWVRTRHPAHRFTSLVLFRNLRTQPHRDSHNDLSSETVVFPISKFQNGEVWVEGEPEKEDEVSCMEKIGDKLIKGKLLPVANRPVTFNPRSWHSTQPWTGDRVVLSAYSIRGSDCLTSEDSDTLRELGFALPGDELKYLSSSESSRPSSGAANTASSSSSKSPEVRVSAIRAVHTFEEQDQEEVKQRRKDARVAKASIENIYTDNVEELLEKLMTDLQVVHTVRQSEAMKVLMKWKPSMKKEIDALEGKGAILRITKEEADNLEDVEYVHGKCVWTVKPPEHPEEEKGNPDRAKYKRKVRIVACGNQVEDDTLSVQDLYSAGATADIVRTVIAEAGYKRWGAAIDDIRAAFLTAPLPKGARRYILRVPKAVIAAGLAQEGECWLVQTALYGFRQSPKWWTTFRNTRAAEAKFSAEHKGVEVRATLKPCVTDPNLFKIVAEVQGKEVVIGYVVFYVDDVLAVGEEGYAAEIVRAHAAENEYSILPATKEWLTMEHEMPEIPTDAEGKALFDANVKAGEVMEGRWWCGGILAVLEVMEAFEVEMRMAAAEGEGRGYYVGSLSGIGAVVGHPHETGPEPEAEGHWRKVGAEMQIGTEGESYEGASYKFASYKFAWNVASCKFAWNVASNKFASYKFARNVAPYKFAWNVAPYKFAWNVALDMFAVAFVRITWDASIESAIVCVRFASYKFAWNVNSYKFASYKFAGNVNSYKFASYKFAGNVNSYKFASYKFAWNVASYKFAWNVADYEFAVAFYKSPKDGGGACRVLRGRRCGGVEANAVGGKGACLVSSKSSEAAATSNNKEQDREEEDWQNPMRVEWELYFLGLVTLIAVLAVWECLRECLRRGARKLPKLRDLARRQQDGPLSKKECKELSELVSRGSWLEEKDHEKLTELVARFTRHDQGASCASRGPSRAAGQAREQRRGEDVAAGARSLREAAASSWEQSMGVRQERAAESSPGYETARSVARMEVGVQADLAMVRLVQQESQSFACEKYVHEPSSYVMVAGQSTRDQGVPLAVKAQNHEATQYRRPIPAGLRNKEDRRSSDKAFCGDVLFQIIGVISLPIFLPGNPRNCLCYGVAWPLRGTRFLHGLEEPILHGELKPENVLIFGSEAKVSDVGFNMAGRGTGAVAYKAPEVYDGVFTTASEVYAFAMICWELVTGKRAWGEYTDLQIMKPVCVEHRRPPLDEKAVTTRLGQIVQESWASDPAKRPSFTQLLVQLAPEPKLPKSLPTALPSHWSGQDLDQGWIAVPASEDLFRELSKLFVVSQPRELGTGRDAGKYHRLWSAWRIEHQSLWDKYAAERNDVIRLLRQLEKSKLQTAEWKSKLEKANAQMPDPLCEHIGEKYLLHGTTPEVLLDILHQGFNDKLASLKGMFGAGAYFAEDPEKIDQYTREDPGHEAPGLEKLHARLYRAGGNRHPGSDVFYCFVVRVTCGACFVSNGLKDKLHDHDTGFQVFARDDRRELSSIPESDPRVPYHTLVVQTGSEAKLRIERFREIISFDANRAYPEYLLAYQRV